VKLTQTVVQNITPADRRQRIKDSVVAGLTLSVETSGRKSWWVDYRKPDGKRSYHTIGRADLFTVAEARERAKEFLARVKLGEDVTAPKNDGPPPSDAPLLKDFLEEHYFPWVLANRKGGKATVARLKASFGFLMNVAVREIDPLSIEKWRTGRLKEVKASSINRDMAALISSLNWGAGLGLIEANPLSRTKHLQERDSQPKARFLAHDERERLMDALEGREEYLRNMVIVSLNTGIRRGALFSLLWSDVDLDKRILTLRGEDAKNSKTNYVPLNAAAYAAFKEWRKSSKGELVFPSPRTGDRLTECRHAWASLVKAAGIKNFRWHDMRHDFASQLVMKGVDLNTVRELMGHADIRMTLRYAHLAPGVKTKAVAALDE
jgi:integrase